MDRFSRLLLVSSALFLNILYCAAAPIPCPGSSEAFLSLPLSERPKLEKILQHGSMPSLMNAVQSTFIAPGNVVPIWDGFASQRIRTIANRSVCLDRTGLDSIQCGNNNLIILPLVTAWSYNVFVEEILSMNLGMSTIDDTLFAPILNPSYQQWEEDVEDFLLPEYFCGNSNEHNPRYRHVVAFTHTCTVNVDFCVEYEPAFISDIMALPTNEEDLFPYHEFLAKWGYGEVNKFFFGGSYMHLWKPQDPAEILYMGRRGGSGNWSDPGNGTKVFYTEAGCRDPAPVELRYVPWHTVLSRLKRGFQQLNVSDHVIDTFFRLYLERLLEHSHPDIASNNFTEPDCIVYTDPPSTDSPSVAPTTVAPSTAPSVASSSNNCRQNSIKAWMILLAAVYFSNIFAR